MKIGSLDAERRVLVIAEVGNNHEGDFALAQDLVGKAAEAGADAVKFQTFRTEDFVRRRDAERFARLKSFELTYEQFTALSMQARAAGLLFISTPLDLTSARFLGTIADAVKIASGDNTFVPLLRAVAQTGRPVILSGGLADTPVLAAQRDFLRSEGVRELAVLHCVTSYPVEPGDANLSAIATLRRDLGGTIGYSDHTLGIEAAVLSVALGARIVEKHFTISKTHSSFRDHQLSADPSDLKEMVERIRRAEVLLGDGVKSMRAGERSLETAVRRSISARRALPAGHVVTWDDLTWLRPAGGLEPGRESEVVGQTLTRAIAEGDWIVRELLK